MSQLDQAKAEEFGGRMLNTLNGSFLGFMLSIGHQTGLLDKMSEMPPATSEEIAHKAELHERYVREWLGAMVTGRIVNYDPQRQTYSLPPEHAASITRAAGTGNIATWMQFLACIGSVEQDIVDCFRKGGGLSYSKYERFHQVMRVGSAQTFDETLIQRTLPLLPGLSDRLGQGIDVLDLGCGSGHAINLMAREFPKSRFKGYDFSEEAIEAGRQEASGWKLANARFEVQDVTRIPESKDFDFITAFDAIHDQAKPREVLAGVARALRDDGTFLMVDIDCSSKLEKNLDRVLAPLIYSISTMHCMSVSLGLNGDGLGTAWGEELARELLAKAGFRSIDVQRVEGDIFNSFYIAKKST
jgi:ubiquinone/menaquinone biosynthesis C-methylase UbiE